ncbi:MAG: glycine zipper 2TM domain-containing protein [Lautropia sp.]
MDVEQNRSAAGQAASNRIHPLSAVAAISVTVLCATGVAAMTGLLPSPFARSADTPPALVAADARPADAKLADAKPAPTAVVPAARPAPKPVTTAPRPIAPIAPVAAAPAVDPNQATVVSIERIVDPGQGSGLGAIGGGVVGGAIGNQIGGGNGKKAMTVLGAVGGAVAGHEIEKRVRGDDHYDVTVRMADGSTRVLRYEDAPPFRAGDRIRVDGRRAS